MADKKKKIGKQAPINIKNKRASFDYEFIDTYTAGIVLTGTEIKSIRQGKASLVDTFCYFNRGELWVKNMYIAQPHGKKGAQTAAQPQGTAFAYGRDKGSGIHNCADTHVHQRKGTGQSGHCSGKG